MDTYDTIIVGGGASALAAALYARRYRLKTLVLEGEPGGETAIAGKIENYPGVLSVDGYELVSTMRKQAEGEGMSFVAANAESASTNYRCFRVKAGGESYEGRTVILAMGMEQRKLGLPHEDELRGKGVHYCATCDGPLFKGKRVGVVGGGDSAVKWANQLSDMGVAEVTMFVRERDLSRAEPANRERLARHTNVKTLFGVTLAALDSKGGKLSSVTYKDAKGRAAEVSLDGIFVAIGAVPRGKLATQLGVRLDARGQIDVDPRTMATSVPGVYAAGDVSNASGGFKQIVTGAAEGAIAATSAYLDVKEHAGVCRYHAVPIAGLLDTPEHCHAVVTAKTHFGRRKPAGRKTPKAKGAKGASRPKAGRRARK